MFRENPLETTEEKTFDHGVLRVEFIGEVGFRDDTIMKGK